MIISSVKELKEKISQILSKSLLESELDKVCDLIKNNMNSGKSDFKLNSDNIVLRASTVSLTIYNVDWGDVWVIPIEMLALFRIIQRSVDYSDISRIRETSIRMLHNNRENKPAEDYAFIDKFKNLYYLCNVIDYKLRGINVNVLNSISTDDFSRLLSDPELLNTDYLYEWLKEDLNLKSFSPIRVNGLRFGDIYV